MIYVSKYIAEKPPRPVYWWYIDPQNDGS